MCELTFLYSTKGVAMTEGIIRELCISVGDLHLRPDDVFYDKQGDLVRVSNIFTVEHDLTSALTHEDRQAYSHVWDQLQSHDGIVTFVFLFNKTDKSLISACYSVVLEFAKRFTLKQWEMESDLITEVPTERAFRSYLLACL